MKAIVQTGYGSPDVLGLQEIERPDAGEGKVLVRVHAAAIHAGDYFAMTGVPYPVRFTVGWPRPKGYVPGYDLAGVVEEVGYGVTTVRPGDAVFAAVEGGACAEYVAVDAALVVPKPDDFTFEQAAAVPTSALAALHGLRDAGKVRPGQKVLINGASGGVGHFAIQIAKTLGVEVTGVCSTRNIELVRSLGADHVIDYTAEDFTQAGPLYDVILDNVGNRSFADIRRALTPDGIHIPNSGSAGIGFVIAAGLRSIFVRQQGRPYLSTPNHDDLVGLKELIDDGKLKPVIDRVYSLEDTPAALGYLGSGHARGKVVISIAGQ